MKTVFYSEIPTHLKIGEKYLGVLGKNVKVLNGFNEDSLLEFIPQNNEYYPIITSIKNPCSIKAFNLLNDKVIIPVYEVKRNLPYKLIYQKSFSVYNDKIIITIIQDGYYKFYLDGAVTYIDELPFLIKDCEIKIKENLLFIIFSGKKHILFAFNLSTLKLLFKSLCETLEIDEYLKVSNLYNCTLPVNIIEEWDLTSFTLKTKTARLIKNQYQIHPKLINLAFFELIALGVDTSFLLAENIKSREKELHDFIGKPIVIFPYYKDITKTVVVLNDTIHLYSLEIIGGLINNILEE